MPLKSDMIKKQILHMKPLWNVRRLHIIQMLSDHVAIDSTKPANGFITYSNTGRKKFCGERSSFFFLAEFFHCIYQLLYYQQNQQYYARICIRY